VVLDTRASLPSQSQLVRTAGQAPLLVAVGSEAEAADCRRLQAAGCEVWICPGATHAARLDALLRELGRRRLTNVLVEGGGRVLGSLLDARQIDEVHVFVAPKLLGGAAAPSPVAGQGVADLAAALELDDVVTESVDGDVYVRGRKRD
jgi:diaminohydroxyphosphoribosylaminopyrimidine deaminase/5-amino-6-(5-phosphoribosylamino)uracil reductase